MTRLITKITADNIDAQMLRYEADTQVLACHDGVRKALLKKMENALIWATAAAVFGVLGSAMTLDLMYNTITMYAEPSLNIARTTNII